jgi:hypothetical protein
MGTSPWGTIFALLLLLPTATCLAEDGDNDSVPSHWGAGVAVLPGKVIVMDQYQRKWQKGRNNCSVDLTAFYQPLPSDSDDFARDYGYPTFNFGLRYSFDHGVTMHREPDSSWGLSETVDYYSRMGNIVSAFAGFERPLWRTRHWMVDYQLDFGLSYSHRKYDPNNNVDDELIGSRLLIFFGAGLHLTYHFTPTWGLRMGLEYYHHSNGALNRPNKGANFLAPTVGLVYEPYYNRLVSNAHSYTARDFHPYWTGSVSVGLGAKTLDEDWQITQFGTAPGESGYHTSRFHVYCSYTVAADVMRRYARRWASGIGVDVWYGDYYKHVREVNEERGSDSNVTPWSVGVAARHAVYYHRWSLQMSLGYYLLRRMGGMAKQQEQRYYEKIGIHYDFGHFRFGVNVKAHRTKADLTEALIAYRWQSR